MVTFQQNAVNPFLRFPSPAHEHHRVAMTVHGTRRASPSVSVTHSQRSKNMKSTSDVMLPQKKNQVCAHCKDCGGSQICEHGRIRYSCRVCGVGRCAHGREKRFCLDCGGSAVCSHGRMCGLWWCAGVSTPTVEGHVQGVRRISGVHTRTPNESVP